MSNTLRRTLRSISWTYACIVLDFFEIFWAFSIVYTRRESFMKKILYLVFETLVDILNFFLYLSFSSKILVRSCFFDQTSCKGICEKINKRKCEKNRTKKSRTNASKFRRNFLDCAIISTFIKITDYSTVSASKWL